MNTSLPAPGFLSRFAKVQASRVKLPHWEHPGVAAFVTFRLGDALPADKLSTWEQELKEWRLTHPEPWDIETAQEFSRTFRATVEKWLDKGSGSCILADEDARKIVESTIRYYDGKRMYVYGFVVMPNHVHLLFMPCDGNTIGSIIRDIKHFTTMKLASRKSWGGHFWQSEYWDTLIRDEVHFKRALSYIKGNNPSIAYDAYANE